MVDFWGWISADPDRQKLFCSENSYELCCFKSGSLILTTDGEIPVEALKPGDKVIGLQGVELPIKWVGTRRVNVAAHPEPARAAPIHIARGALGENTPHRDLYVSPDHAMYLNGVLIKASALVNGVNIVQVPVGEVVYHHVEFDEHAVIFAEGAATESFLEREGSRSHFSNSTGATMLHPEFGAALAQERRKGVGSRVNGWMLARTAGVGHRLYRLAERFGLRGVAGAAARLNGLAMQRLIGAVAPRVSFGPVVDEARRQIADRARSGMLPEASRRPKAA
jgi:hypothetical protein